MALNGRGENNMQASCRVPKILIQLAPKLTDGQTERTLNFLVRPSVNPVLIMSHYQPYRYRARQTPQPI
jgi:hypothetical protein